jgi:hypothetical protein
MSSSVTLSQELNTAVSGVNLKWVNANLGTVKEITLVYFKDASDAVIKSKEIGSGCTKYNLPPSEYVAGVSYKFQLQVTDVSGVSVYSIVLPITTPYLLVPPVISQIVGVDAGLNVTLQSTSNSLTSSNCTVEFFLRRADGASFWIIKPYASSGAYQLRDTDDALLANNQSYNVACMFQPSASHPLYKSPSDTSNTMLGTPTNSPNAPQSVSVASVGSANLDVLVSWTRPNDFTDWSSDPSFAIEVELNSVVQTLYTNVLTYTFTGLARGQSYVASVRYINSFGPGPYAYSSSLTPTSVPDVPTLSSASGGDLQSVLAWSAPAFTGQSAITGYLVFKNGAQVASVSASTFSYTATGLQNGFSYSFYVKATNAIGSSIASNSISASPYGQMSIVSVVASGKTLTATIKPNGKPVQDVIFFALDADPSASDISGNQTFLVDIPQQQIDQTINANIQVVKNSANLSSSIASYACIATGGVNTAFMNSWTP